MVRYEYRSGFSGLECGDSMGTEGRVRRGALRNFFAKSCSKSMKLMDPFFIKILYSSMFHIF